jgi:hypothetical protein
VQENSGRQIRREIKGGQLGEKVGEKTGEKVGESLGEIHKLKVALNMTCCNSFAIKNLIMNN